MYLPRVHSSLGLKPAQYNTYNTGRPATAPGPRRAMAGPTETYGRITFDDYHIITPVQLPRMAEDTIVFCDMDAFLAISKSVKLTRLPSNAWVMLS